MVLCGTLFFFPCLSIKMKSRPCSYGRSRSTGRCKPARRVPCANGEDRSGSRTKAGLLPCKRKNSKNLKSTKVKSKKAVRHLKPLQFLCLSKSCNENKPKGAQRGTVVSVIQQPKFVEYDHKNSGRKTYQAKSKCLTCNTDLVKFISKDVYEAAVNK